jgi:selenocysteine-specific elongation factor
MAGTPISRVIATAGHIDHGKSSLVKVLTGVDPDRLPEEKARGMTIELGFARLDLGNGIAVAVIDVPGHERFVRHMVAGVGGIDLALLVVAADEAIMPQTIEHVAILDLLGVRHGVVAMTKCDLVDEEWQALVVDEVRNALRDTSLDRSPIVPLSSITGTGINALRETLARVLLQTPERLDRGRPRLAIDRVFSSSGHGTVVTGTLLDGRLAVGQEVELAPTGRRARIRSLQSHGERLETATQGRRVAVNLAGTSVSEVERGMVICAPADMPAVLYVDAHIRAVATGRARNTATREPEVVVSHNMPVVLHTGAVEAQGRIRLLDADALRPGATGWAQIKLDTPIAALRGDRFILRAPSPARTVAGGTIVEVNPRRRRRFSPIALERLQRLAAATPEERVLDSLAASPLTAAELLSRTDLPQPALETVLANLRARAAIVTVGSELSGEASSARAALDWSAYLAAPAWLDQTRDRVRNILREYHQTYPLRRGMAGETLRGRIDVPRRLWAELVRGWRASGLLGASGDLLSIADYVVHLTGDTRLAMDRWLRQLDDPLFSPPSGSDLTSIDGEILQAMIASGDPVPIAEGLYLRAQAFAAMRDEALKIIESEGSVGVARLRDALHSSRKVALALLERLDDLHVTRRVGDARLRGPAALGNPPSGDRY